VNEGGRLPPPARALLGPPPSWRRTRRAASGRGLTATTVALRGTPLRGLAGAQRQRPKGNDSAGLKPGRSIRRTATATADGNDSGPAGHPPAWAPGAQRHRPNGNDSAGLKPGRSKRRTATATADGNGGRQRPWPCGPPPGAGAGGSTAPAEGQRLGPSETRPLHTAYGDGNGECAARFGLTGAGGCGIVTVPETGPYCACGAPRAASGRPRPAPGLRSACRESVVQTSALLDPGHRGEAF